MFPAGSKEIKFSVPIIDDKRVENIESFNLIIDQTSLDKVYRIQPFKATVYIVSDDKKGEHNLC